MELVGEQKRIQALFSELRLADEQTAPRFAAVWNRAQTRTVQPRAFNLSFVAATALLVCALVSFGLWSKYSQRNAPQTPVVMTKTPAPAAVPVQAAKENAAVNPSRPDEKSSRDAAISRARRLAAQKRAVMLAVNRKAARDAEAISSWESPTSALLKSQNDELLKSIPQLNESADELKSFLPNTPK